MDGATYAAPPPPHAQHYLQNFRPNTALPPLSKFRHSAALEIQNLKFSPNIQPLSLQHTQTIHFPSPDLFHFPSLPPAYFYRKGKRALPENLHSHKSSVYSPPPPVLFLLLSLDIHQSVSGAMFLPFCFRGHVV